MESRDGAKWTDQSQWALLEDVSLGENISRPRLLYPQLPCTDGLSFHWQPKLGEVSWGLTASVPFMGNWIPEKTEITQLLKISMFAWPGGSLRMVRWTLRSGAASQTTSPPASVFISILTGCSLYHMDPEDPSDKKNTDHFFLNQIFGNCKTIPKM